MEMQYLNNIKYLNIILKVYYPFKSFKRPVYIYIYIYISVYRKLV